MQMWSTVISQGGITEESILSGVYLGWWRKKPHGSRLLWVLNYKLGSLHLPGDNGELLQVCVMKNKVIKYLLYFVQSIIKYPV